MKIFVTGGTGFIGTHLIRLLRDTPHDVVCLARKTSEVTRLRDANASIVVGDVTDRQSLADGMRGCAWVINLANFYEFWTTDERLYHAVNIDGTRNVMDAALAEKVSKVVHVSTVAAYGNAAWPITEDSPIGDRRATRYCQSKYDGEQLARRLHEEKGLPLVVVSPSAVIGPDDPKASGRYIGNLSRGRLPVQIFTKQSFSFVYVGDVARIILKALERHDNVGEKYLASAYNHTWGEINRMITDVSGRRLPVLTLPDWMTLASAYLFTGLAGITRQPPMWDMSVAQMAIMRQGFNVDGSKAARELGITYTPIRDALKEAVGSFARH